MAIVNGIISITIKDADKELASLPIYCTIDTSVTVAELITLGNILQADLDAVLDGAIQQVRALITLDHNFSVKADPVAGSEIERTALLTNSVTGSAYGYSMDIPAFAEALYDGNAVPNTGDAGDWETFVTASQIGGKLIFTDRYANPLDEFVRWVKTFRKHRKQTKRAG
jgi:hypothetical protein